MTWFKLDDKFDQHRKILAVGPAAAWLHVAAFCFTTRNLMDGFIPEAALAGLGGYSKVRARKLVERLVEVNLWETRDGGWVIHDYLQWNRSRAETEQQREAARVRMNNRRSSPKQATVFAGSSPDVPTSTSTSEQGTGTNKQKEPDVGTEVEVGSSHEHSANIFSLYEQTIGPFDPHMATKLQEAEKEYSQERIQYAFREASENDARTWRYVEAVLKGKGPTKRVTRGADDGEIERLQRRYEKGYAKRAE